MSIFKEIDQELKRITSSKEAWESFHNEFENSSILQFIESHFKPSEEGGAWEYNLYCVLGNFIIVTSDEVYVTPPRWEISD